MNYKINSLRSYDTGQVQAQTHIKNPALSLKTNEFLEEVATVYRAHYLRVINRYLKNSNLHHQSVDAEDILHDACIKIMRNGIEGTDLYAQQRSYFRKTLTSVCIDYLRKQSYESARAKMPTDTKQSVGQIFQRKPIDTRFLIEIFQAKLTPEQIGEFLPFQNISPERLYMLASEAQTLKSIFEKRFEEASRGSRLKSKKIMRAMIEYILEGVPTDEIALIMNDDPKSPVYQKYKNPDGTTNTKKFSDLLYKKMERFKKALAKK